LIASGEVILPVLAWTPRLKVREQAGSFVDEYRIKAGRVEVRALDLNGVPYPGYSEWITLTAEEIRLHFVKQTQVAKWLKRTLAQRVRPAHVQQKKGGLRKPTAAQQCAL
jgi:hypothetical protein